MISGKANLRETATDAEVIRNDSPIVQKVTAFTNSEGMRGICLLPEMETSRTALKCFNKPQLQSGESYSLSMLKLLLGKIITRTSKCGLR